MEKNSKKSPLLFRATLTADAHQEQDGVLGYSEIILCSVSKTRLAQHKRVLFLKKIGEKSFKNKKFLILPLEIFFKTKNALVMATVSTYLNFAHHTEEAFHFYRSVFGGDFRGGIVRFGEMPPIPGAPPLSETDQNLVLHIELPILGGHVLMGSDAPESFGFKISTGNNMHINLETDSREQTDYLFNALSAEGTVTQPLQDMFWGAYYGSCTDRYGVQWMFNCDTKQQR